MWCIKLREVFDETSIMECELVMFVSDEMYTLRYI